MSLVCKYGSDINYIDVTKKVQLLYQKGDYLYIPHGIKIFNNLFVDPCPSIMKNLIIEVDAKSYTIKENDLSSHLIPIFQGLERPQLICEYGTGKIFKEVTDLVMKSFESDGNLYFPAGKKNFNHYFTDIVEYQLKHLTILLPNKSYIIYENDLEEHRISLQRNLITFVIPTINRPTLVETLDSLEKQNDDRWEAICIFDQVVPSQEIKDKLERNPKFRYEILTEKLGQGKNSGGLVRNYGISKVTTEWIGFVDDDDTLTNNYVMALQDEIERNKEVECIIFRMLDGQVIPAPKSTNFMVHNVGISFAYRTKLFHEGYQFVPSGIEDYLLLEKIRTGYKKMVISPYITYFVRNKTAPDILEKLEKENLRVIIN